jgi:predicted amidohydrolase
MSAEGMILEAEIGGLRVAAVQMVSGRYVAENLEKAAMAVQEAARQGAELVVLPEYFCLMGAADTDKLAHAEEAAVCGQRPSSAQSPIQWALSEWARSFGVWLVGGTLPIQGTLPGKVFNAMTVFSPDGLLQARYDKIHLFAFHRGQEHYDEGRVLQAGHEPVVVLVPAAGKVWRVGLSVCYDLRFPELYRRMMHPPCDVLVVGAAFTHTTGQAHWELLLRARAVENQCFVVASAQGGIHDNGRQTFGHSMVIDPWGQPLAVHPVGEGMAEAQLSAQRLDEVRSQLPCLEHRLKL